MLLRMFGRDLETARSVVYHNLLEIWRVVKQIVPYTARHEGLLHPLHLTYAAVERQQTRVVVVQIGATLGMQARRTAATPAQLLVAPAHAVHVGRRRPDV